MHEKLDVEKRQAIRLEGILLHHSQDSIAQSLQKMNDYSNSTSAILDEKGKHTTLFKASLHKHWTFIRGYVFRRGFLDGRRGFMIAKLSAYGAYFKYVKLWERQL